LTTTPSFECPRCGAISCHPDDVREGYCGACHAWTGDGFGDAAEFAAAYAARSGVTAEWLRRHGRYPELCMCGDDDCPGWQMGHQQEEAIAEDAARARAAGFDCEAYGPEGRQFGALCFAAGALTERVCPSLAACQQLMGAERQRVFRRISELAAAGNPDFAYLESVFTSPDQLLGGEDG
jgi:hypothetical protein